jgi:hypothetical protein
VEVESDVLIGLEHAGEVEIIFYEIRSVDVVVDVEIVFASGCKQQACAHKYK